VSVPAARELVASINGREVGALREQGTLRIDKRPAHMPPATRASAAGTSIFEKSCVYPQGAEPAARELVVAKDIV